MSCTGIPPNTIRYSSRPSWDPAFTNNRGKKEEVLSQEMRKVWEVSGHCSSLVFPTPYPDIQWDTSSCGFHFLLHSAGGIPDQELVSAVRQSYYRVLAKLNYSELQVKNFILPVQLMKLKFVDPYSRQRILEEICRYLSSQTQLRSLVMEQASITFTDLCNILLAVSQNSYVRRLYLWNILDKCEVPFRGPLESEINLDDLPRIPYTYNPGGRKFLRNLQKVKEEQSLNETTTGTDNIDKGKELPNKILRDSEVLSQIAWIESLAFLRSSLTGSSSTMSQPESHSRLAKLLAEPADPDSRDTVCCQRDVGVQCGMSQDNDVMAKKTPIVKADSNKTLTGGLLTKTKIQFSKDYLKMHEYSEINKKTLRNIYMVALSGLTNLAILSVNYAMLADGTGETLLSIGSVMTGRLQHLEILCLLEDLPWAFHQQQDPAALHAIPDITWAHIKISCPNLRAHFVCVNMVPYDITNKFITRSIPLQSLNIDSGFLPTLLKPQIMFFSTLKFLYLHFKETFEHINIVLWHASGRVDSSLLRLIMELPQLRTFGYYGPLQYKDTIRQLCNAALRPSSKIDNFRLMVQGDPCYPHIARDLTAKLYLLYRDQFAERSIQFMLGTHNSCSRDSMSSSFNLY